MEKAKLLHTLMVRSLSRANSKRTLGTMLSSGEAVRDFFNAVEKMVQKVPETKGDIYRTARKTA